MTVRIELVDRLPNLMPWAVNQTGLAVAPRGREYIAENYVLALDEYYTASKNLEGVYRLIKILDELPNESAWMVGHGGDLLINANRINDVEDALANENLLKIY